MIIVLSLIAALGQGSSAEAAQLHESHGEVAYVTTPAAWGLTTYDLASLQRGLLHECAPKLPGVAAIQGLTYLDGRLYGMDLNWENLDDRFIRIQPANGDPQVVGLPGVSQSFNWTVEANPVDGAVYGVESYRFLHRIDPSTGVLTFIGELSWSSDALLGARSMAIDSNGRAIVSTDGTGLSGPGFSELDLESGALRPLGRLPIGQGWMHDLAFDSNDQLWAIYGALFTPSKNGLYKVDPEELTFEKVLDEPTVGITWRGLAFGPASDVTPYCVASSSTSGCVPHLDSNGLPSASAPSGCLVTADEVPGGSLGALVWGVGDRTQVPFGGGVLCIDGPLSWTDVSDSGGNDPSGSDCSGSWSVDFNAVLFADALLAPGTTVRCQWLGRDASGPGGSALVLTPALELVLAP